MHWSYVFLALTHRYDQHFNVPASCWYAVSSLVCTSLNDLADFIICFTMMLPCIRFTMMLSCICFTMMLPCIHFTMMLSCICFTMMLPCIVWEIAFYTNRKAWLLWHHHLKAVHCRCITPWVKLWNTAFWSLWDSPNSIFIFQFINLKYITQIR